MKKMSIMMLMGTLFIGTLSFAEREVSFDYEKNLKQRNETDQNNIKKYAEKNKVSIEVSTKLYKERLEKEFKENEVIRQEMMMSNLSD
ncbi:hypothetical protein [Cetobacterium sp.]|uniref:hypothetical protein n=1 Tax=Cetobacterium sp. TaxID=2071632 RepID=UPI003F38F8F6